MSTNTLVFADETTQYIYSPGRQAIAEWWKGQSRWILSGWVWDGEVTSFEQAKALVAEMRGEVVPANH